jgi:cytochrome P450/NADPH-cytochrome P450 reductase
MTQGMTYLTGDSLSILPLNHKATIQPALSCFHLFWHTYLKLESDGAQDLSTGYPASIADLLGAFVELGQTATPVV